MTIIIILNIVTLYFLSKALTQQKRYDCKDECVPILECLTSRRVPRLRRANETNSSYHLTLDASRALLSNLQREIWAFHSLADDCTVQHTTEDFVIKWNVPGLIDQRSPVRHKLSMWICGLVDGQMVFQCWQTHVDSFSAH